MVCRYGGGALSLTAPNVNSRSTANLARLRDEKFNFSFKEILYETTRYHSKFSFSGFPENWQIFGVSFAPNVNSRKAANYRATLRWKYKLFIMKQIVCIFFILCFCLGNTLLCGVPANCRICGDKVGVPRRLYNLWSDKQTSDIAKVAVAT